MGDATRLKARILLASLPLVLGAGLLSAPGNRLLARISPTFQEKLDQGLFAATLDGTDQRVQWFASRGANPNWANPLGTTVFHIAAGAEPERSDFLFNALKGYRVNWNARDISTEGTPFSLLVLVRLHGGESGWEFRCKQALRQGADANARINDTSLIELAANGSNLKVVKLLCRYGARLDKLDSLSAGLLVDALKSYPERCSDASGVVQPACEITRSETREWVETLLEEGANPTKADLNHITPLRWASQHRWLQPFLPLLNRYATKFRPHRH